MLIQADHFPMLFSYETGILHRWSFDDYVGQISPSSSHAFEDQIAVDHEISFVVNPFGKSIMRKFYLSKSHWFLDSRRRLVIYIISQLKFLNWLGLVFYQPSNRIRWLFQCRYIFDDLQWIVRCWRIILQVNTIK